MYFRELRIPLFTFELYDQFINASRNKDYDTRLIELKNLVHQLPESHFRILDFLLRHLKQYAFKYENDYFRVAGFGNLNKMMALNLGIVFGPTLLRPSDGPENEMKQLMNTGN